ncbi:hypothetical protein Pint_11451 [Pistacia integerrima]|uniref:Uncharacterized protein n=1 Tax=Pistacia integerrima TaxID=434235 RepID=A0ACC0XIT8_9ROSI|nr:hypothetical protein Pint_11451 [Pistacia integerrima]
MVIYYCDVIRIILTIGLILVEKKIINPTFEMVYLHYENDIHICSAFNKLVIDAYLV